MNDEPTEPLNLEKRANFYFKRDLPVHCKYKRGFWKNGYILEMSSDFFSLNEFEEGLMPVFFNELLDIDKFEYKKKEEKNADDK